MVRSRLLALGLAIYGSALFGCVGRFDDGPGGAGPAPDTTALGEPGTVTLHRLNRPEYNNTVHDLLGDTSQPADNFPADNLASFDNNADVLTISPVLAQAYATAAESVVANALQAGNPARARVFTCDPITDGHDPCARKIIGDFALRAWRRPPAPDEIDRLFALVGVAESNGDDFATGIGLAVEATLVNPSFLFRVELDPDPNSRVQHKLNDYELASRLSYFIYSSMPDPALFAAAAAGTLHDPQELAAQVHRMLADPKASALIDGFGAQWLFVRRLRDAHPSPVVFPQFDEPLRAAMGEETLLFFKELVDGDHDFRELLDANFTFVNGPLAQLYGIQGVNGDAFQRVSLAGNPRGGGILTHASMLTVTSTPMRGSIPKRGRFILSQLLCQPPPDPPAGIPQIPEVPMPGRTTRENLEAVTSADPICNSCHSLLNPLGGGLGHFNGIGIYQQLDNQLPVNAAGKLPDGTAFDGNLEEAKVLKDNPAFPRCVARQAISYALGRDLTAADVSRVAVVSADVGKNGNRWKDLVARIVADDLFTTRRGGGP